MHSTSVPFGELLLQPEKGEVAYLQNAAMNPLTEKQVVEEHSGYEGSTAPVHRAELGRVGERVAPRATTKKGGL